MQAIYHVYTTEAQAWASYHIMRARGFQVSYPFRDQHNNWLITHLIYG